MMPPVWWQVAVGLVLLALVAAVLTVSSVAIGAYCLARHFGVGLEKEPFVGCRSAAACARYEGRDCPLNGGCLNNKPVVS